MPLFTSFTSFNIFTSFFIFTGFFIGIIFFTEIIDINFFAENVILNVILNICSFTFSFLA